MMTAKPFAIAIRAVCLVFSTLFFSASALASDSKPLSGMALVEQLRAGGYAIYFRHEATDWSLQDDVEKRDDWLSCNPTRMRQLSTAGRNTARQTGAAMRKLGIPVGRVFASPYCRTMETALLMDLGEVEASGAVMNLRVAEYFGGRGAIVANARHLLAQQPPEGTNHVIVAHGNVAVNATSVYPEEGEGLVFKPGGGSEFEFVGRLTAAEWRRLAGAM